MHGVRPLVDLALRTAAQAVLRMSRMIGAAARSSGADTYSVPAVNEKREKPKPLLKLAACGA